jgi:hypothetical protein
MVNQSPLGENEKLVTPGNGVRDPLVRSMSQKARGGACSA